MTQDPLKNLTLVDLFNQKFSFKKPSVTNIELKKIISGLLKELLLTNIPVSFLASTLSNLEKSIVSSDSKKINLQIVKKKVKEMFLDILSKDNTFENAVDKCKLENRPLFLVLMAPYGAGKTTTMIKIANYCKKIKKLETICIAADTFRAGAYDQVKQLCQKIGVYHYGSEYETNPKNIVKRGLNKIFFSSPTLRKVVIIDTAGRDCNKDDLKTELTDIFEVLDSKEFDHLNPIKYKMMVVDSGYGEAATKNIEYFSSLNVDGITLSKYDNKTVKPGFALFAAYTASLKRLSKVPIVFLGTGEHPGDLEEFDAEYFVETRLLGLHPANVKYLENRILSVENVEEKVKKNTENLLSKNKKFTFQDFIDQMDLMLEFSDDGRISKLIEMIPNGSKIFNIFEEKSNKKNKKIADEVLTKENFDEIFNSSYKSLKIVLDSMTQKEIQTCDDTLFTVDEYSSSAVRISRGCGLTPEQIIKNALRFFKPFKEMVNNIKKLPEGTRNAIQSGDFFKNVDMSDSDSMIDSVMGLLTNQNSKFVTKKMQKRLNNGMMSAQLKSIMQKQGLK